MDHFPRDRDENKKYLKFHHSVDFMQEANVVYKDLPKGGN